MELAIETQWDELPRQQEQILNVIAILAPPAAALKVVLGSRRDNHTADGS